MLQNAYFLAKIGADTAENEQHFAEILPIGRRVPRQRTSAWRAATGSAPASSRTDVKDLEELEAARTVEAKLRTRMRASEESGSSGLGLGSAKFGKISKILQIFSGLVLGCIKPKFCKKICV